MPVPQKILLYGYGNPGRQDDGLGNAFIEEIQKWVDENQIPGIETDSNYQLNIEDAELISGMDFVFFVDASEEQELEEFKITKVNPSEARIEFTMHASSAAFVLDLCQKIFNKYPETYQVHIRGYEWNFQEGLSDKARQNLNQALGSLKPLILDPQRTRDIAR